MPINVCFKKYQKPANALLPALASLVILASCDNPSETAERAQKTVTQAFQTAQQSIPQKAEEVKTYTDEEIAKLQAFEYRIVELASETTAAEVETSLQMLGRERWDCFDIAWRLESVYVTCKRKPASWFRLMQRFVE